MMEVAWERCRNPVTSLGQMNVKIAPNLVELVYKLLTIFGCGKTAVHDNTNQVCTLARCRRNVAPILIWCRKQRIADPERSLLDVWCQRGCFSLDGLSELISCGRKDDSVQVKIQTTNG